MPAMASENYREVSGALPVRIVITPEEYQRIKAMLTAGLLVKGFRLIDGELALTLEDGSLH
jgi:hypothetical protein